MKKVGIYTLPDNAELAGIGFLGCYYYNSVGDIYRVRFVNGVQYFLQITRRYIDRPYPGGIVTCGLNITENGKFQKQQQRPHLVMFLAFIFIWMVNGISAAGRITIIKKYVCLMCGILKNA